MEASKEPIAVRILRLNRQILGKSTGAVSKLNKRTIDREALLDALVTLYDECNDEATKKLDEVVKAFVDKYRSTLAELRNVRVCYSDFEVLQNIGKGHFGEIHMVREKETGDVYAMKTIRKDVAQAAGAVDERDVLAMAPPPWLPKLQYAFQDTKKLYLVMELCSGGDLAGLLARRHNPLSERDAAFYIAEVALALKVLHTMGFVHRDVKPNNILIDRCGHIKLCDLGSSARLAEAKGERPATPDYVAPELLAADCDHARCLQYCRRLGATAVSACDYWSLGVIAFELVTLRRPFSSTDEDSIAQILANVHKYEKDPKAEPPFEDLPNGPNSEWRSLVAGLLRVAPARRYNYLDTTQHAALAHLCLHTIRDQAPPWVPLVRGPEDASFLPPAPWAPAAACFRARPPFAGELAYIGFSYVASDDHEESTRSFNSSHDCTAIDMGTYKSAEKLAAIRGREIASLQSKLAAAEAAAATAASSEAEKARKASETEHERTRAKLQGEITALSLQNKRLERQIEVEKEERMALQRTNQDLATGLSDRSNAELKVAQAQIAELQCERDALNDDVTRLKRRVAELESETARAISAAETAKAQQRHYKDTIAKERALRRQTITGGEAESREAAAKVAAAEANLAMELRCREKAEKALSILQEEKARVDAELEEVRKELLSVKPSLSETRRTAEGVTQQLMEAQLQLAQERMRADTLHAQIQELQRVSEEASRREGALEEQGARTEARLNERLNAAEARAAAALADDARHREKVTTLEQLVRRLEREVSALERRGCQACEAREATREAREATREAREAEEAREEAHREEARSDTESVGDVMQAQVALLKEQLERAENHLQARADEIAALKQVTRGANLARWRKEREFNDLSLEAKANARDVKRLEERLSHAVDARRSAEQKSNALQTEIDALKPQWERASKELESVKEQLTKLKKQHDICQAEVDRSRNDIRKLKSELTYSEQRRAHAETQEELSSRERAALREELTAQRAQHLQLTQNNKALQEACSLLEEQLTDLEKLSDMHEIKNKDLESETARLHRELEATRERLDAAERLSAERAAAAAAAAASGDEARRQARHDHSQLTLLRERLESREARVAELEAQAAALEGARAAGDAARGAAARRVRDLQEECAALRTRAHAHHAASLALQASLAEAQDQISALREDNATAAAWWRTRETKAEATLRQQAKLIDFLQAKVEEAGRKKSSLSNKLFGRSGRRSNVSPPLRRANRELREEVERLRAKLAATGAATPKQEYPETPKRERSKPLTNGKDSGSPSSPEEDKLLIVWPDGTREKMHATAREDGGLLLRARGATYRAEPRAREPDNLPHNEASRAFTISVEGASHGSTAAVVCGSAEEVSRWTRGAGAARELARCPPRPLCALHLARGAVVIGAEDGLYSLRGRMSLGVSGAVECVAVAGARALLWAGGGLREAAARELLSASRRAPALRPALATRAVPLPCTDAPRLIQTLDESEGECVAGVSCGRRVFVLRWDAGAWVVLRALTADAGVRGMLRAGPALLLAGGRLLRAPAAAPPEPFAPHHPTVAAAAARRSAPAALHLLGAQPPEVLVCYAECGVFLDERGERTRDDAAWGGRAHAWTWSAPFLFAAGDDCVWVLHVPAEPAPCTCSPAECAPRAVRLRVRGAVLLGAAPGGAALLAAGRAPGGLALCVLRGRAAFRDAGASLESLESLASDSTGDESPPPALDDSGPLDQSGPLDKSGPLDDPTPAESEPAPDTGFLADIRQRAQQLRSRARAPRSSDDVIKEILTTEVGVRLHCGRKSPATTSEFDSDSDSDARTDTQDLCADMFARQVRFQPQ